jgi:hypothetical protein
MWLFFSAGKALRFAALFLVLGFVAGFLVGQRAHDAAVPPAPSVSVLRLALPAGMEVTRWCPTGS